MAVKEKRTVAKGSRRGMFLIGTVVIVLMVIMFVKGKRLEGKNDAYASQIQTLREQMTEEEDRAEQIKQYKAYTKTDAYTEKAAREKFGLVYPDEVVFKPAG